MRQVGLMEVLDRGLHLSQVHLPYHKSDRLLNICYSARCEVASREDRERRRSDEAFLDALGARCMPAACCKAPHPSGPVPMCSARLPEAKRAK
jgi:hypothetical protein